MSSWAPSLREGIVRGERGFTSIELLVAAAVGIVVLGAILSLFETTARIAPKDVERGHAIREAQVGLHRMVRELRQAYAVNATTPTFIDVNVTIGGQDRRVSYECERPRCLRREGNPGSDLATAPTEVVVDRLLNGSAADPVFTYSPATFPPAHVEAKIVVPAAGERRDGYRHRVVLDDGFDLRNLNLGG